MGCCSACATGHNAGDAIPSRSPAPMSARQPAPELTPALHWINADPLRLAALRGRIVVLWFWHAGAVWCHNSLEDLRALQSRHGGSVCVIGIHVPKFDAERDPRQVLKAVNRHGIRFPVASDGDWVAWQHFGIAGWPTTVLVDAAGCVRKVLAGDMRGSELAQATAQLVAEAGGAEGALAEPFHAVQHPEGRHALAFPSGLAASASHLYVSDSAHHRILECTHDGHVVRQFGSGSAGFTDGDAAGAAFQSPRGLALMRNALYVADTGNHALRCVQLDSGEVVTAAGTGVAGIPRSGRTSDEATPATGLPTLNAPWDVAAGNGHVYIAMAGAQQVWRYAPVGRELQPVAGSGHLGLADGVGEEAMFAQPAALALVQRTLYVADAASSSIRSVHLGEGRGVQTLLGRGLFEFGDSDGTRSAARLQAPAGLALDPSSPLLWIADTGNDCLKVLRLGGGDLRRFDLEYRLHEPTALAAHAGMLWLANSAAHELLRVDVESGAVRRLPVGE